MVTTNMLIAVFAGLLIIASAAERLIEIAKPLVEKISAKWQPSVKIALAIVIGFGLAYLFRFDLLASMMIVGVSPIIGYLASGLIASVGSSVLHPILEWLKTLKNNTTVTTTEYNGGAKGTSSITTEVKVSADDLAVEPPVVAG